MNAIRNRRRHSTTVTTTAAAAAVAAMSLTLGLPSTASAGISGPYSVDSNTMHLWHLDEGTTPAADQAHYNYVGTFTNKPDANQPLNALIGNATLGNTSFTGFGTALSTANVSQTPPYPTLNLEPGLGAVAPADGTGDNVDHTFDHPTNHSFTMEAIVKIGFDPTANWNAPMEIIAGEGDAADSSDRSWQFRLEPKGFNSRTAPALRFQKISGFGGVGGSTANYNLDANIPTTGPDAIQQNEWYHVAVTYNGNLTDANSLKLYWTKLDSSRVLAQQIGSGNMNGWLRQQDCDFSLGNEMRDFNGELEPFVGLIDEVRISDVARASNQFFFTGASFWNVDADGNWDTAGNWLGGVPNAVGAVASLGGGGGATQISAPRSITLSGSRTVGVLAFDNATASFNVTGASGALLMDNGAGTASIISVNTGTHTIDVPVTIDSDGAAISVSGSANSLTISKAVGGAGAITKAGSGVLVLPVANSYSGNTTVTGGVLRAADGVGLPASSNLNLNGGVWETSANVTRGVGTGAGQVQISGGVSGFSARGGAVTVSLGGIGTPTALTWGDAAFNPSALLLNNAGTADSTITFANSIDLGAANRSIQVNAGTAVLTGTLSNSGSLSVNGDGLLIVSNTNTYTGGTQIAPGTPASGAVRAAATNALGTGQISLAPNGNASTGRLELTGNISLPNSFFFAGRNNASVAIQNISGNNELRNTLSINVGGANYWIQSDAGLLTLSGAEPAAAGVALTAAATGTRTVTFQGAGSGLVSGQINNGSATINVVKIGAGTWTLAGNNTQTGTLLVSDGTLAVGHVNGLGAGPGPVIDTTGHVRLVPGLSGAVKVNSLAVNGTTASLDMTDNDMVVASTTPTSTVVGYVITGRNGGAWGGPGIDSANAKNNANHTTGLGVLTGAEYSSVGGTGVFNGATYAAGDTLVKYTWNGDANFDGRVTFDDYVKIDTGFNTHLTGWLNGDFNYSGAVNFDDYVLIDISFNQQNGTLGRAVDWISGDDRTAAGLDNSAVEMMLGHLEQFGSAYGAAFLAAVPEPGSTMLALCVPALVGMFRRRRRHA